VSHHNNPYSQAADAYGKTSSSSPSDQRALEGQLLMKSARKLQMLRDKIAGGEKVSLEEIEEVLTYNRKLWTVFVDAATEGTTELPRDLATNIANIGIFVFKRTNEVLLNTTPENIDALININRQIGSGLLKTPKGTDTSPENGQVSESVPAKKAGNSSSTADISL